MLRPNKNVERKLIVASIQSMRARFDFKGYRYVGLGSMWFVDFVLMHKVVGIDDMVTIEREKSRAKRVEFNKPFACIMPRMQEAGDALGEVLPGKKSLTWLDYDGALKQALDGDLELAIGSMEPGSVIFVSVNARVEQLAGNVREGETLEPVDYLSAITDTDMSLQAARLTRNDFPDLVRELLQQTMASAALSLSPGRRYVPLWAFSYADDAEMVTVGGMLVDDAVQVQLDAAIADGIDYSTPDALFRIEVPVLTDKEKRALDRLLPSAGPLSVNALDFELRQREVDAYQAFYLQYPMFNELAS